MGYGLTETSPTTHLNTFKYLKPIKIGTCGPAFPRTECKIAEDGEILIRGPQVMKGYYNRPEDTAQVLTKDGWFYTGDIGTIDADGYLTITDRKKDILITAGGKNVSPQVIEGQFMMHPLIEQIAIVGDQKKYLVAIIVPCFPELLRWTKSKNITETDPKKLIAIRKSSKNSTNDRRIEQAAGTRGTDQTFCPYRPRLQSGNRRTDAHAQDQAQNRSGQLQRPHRGDV